MIMTPRSTFTHKDHLQYGYGNDLLEFDPDLPFVIQYGAAERPYESLWKESIRAAQLIGERAQSSIFLCLSGGNDSECMARAFLAAKVPFEAAILRLPYNLNGYDIKFAETFCQEQKIRINYYDIDPIEIFHSDRYEYYAKTYRCGYPILIMHLWLMDQIRGHAIFAGTPPALALQNSELKWQFPNDNYMTYHRYLARTNQFGVGHFFLYTPEQIHSYMNMPSFKTLMAFPQLATSQYQARYLEKVRLYQECGFAVEAKPAKYTGFENFEFYYRRKFGTPWFLKYQALYLEWFPGTSFEAPEDFEHPEIEISPHK